MAYSLPTFNLICDIYTTVVAGYPPVFATKVLRLAAVPCALVYGRRVNMGVSFTSGGVSAIPQQSMTLLLPALTDIRGFQDSLLCVDIVEVPSGSGRWYRVPWVDDIGKGYANEHRFALILPVPALWVAPYP